MYRFDGRILFYGFTKFQNDESFHFTQKIHFYSKLNQTGISLSTFSINKIWLKYSVT